jgi:Origin of replication binding protein
MKDATSIVPARGMYPDIHRHAVGLGLWASKQEFTPASPFSLAHDWGVTGEKGPKFYISYEKYEELVWMLRENPGYNFYECIRWLPVRGSPETFMHFDIERYDCHHTPEAVLDAFLRLLSEYFERLRDEAGETFADCTLVVGDNVRVYDSTITDPKMKTSLHVVIDIGMRNQDDNCRVAKALCELVLQRTDMYSELAITHDKCAIDDTIYSPNRLFRCVYQRKRGLQNPFKPVGRTSKDAADCLVTYHPGKSRPLSRWAVPERLDETIAISAGRPAAALCRKIGGEECREMTLDGTSLRKHSDYFNSIRSIVQVMQGKVNVVRVAEMDKCKMVYTLESARCPYAGRVHASNHVYLSRYGRSPDISICCTDPDCRDRELPIKVKFNPGFEIGLSDQSNLDNMHPQSGFIKWDEDYDEPCMRPYPDHGLVIVRANMGTGKTKALKDFVQDSVAADAKILIVTFSRTLAGKLYNDFCTAGKWTDYASVKGPIQSSRVVVCLDSLYRVETRDFDYVFIDEALSVFLHFNSPLMLRSSQNATTLELLIRQSRCTYFIDACIDQTFTTHIVQYFSRVMGVPAYWIRNRYVRNPGSRTCAIKVKRGGAAGSFSEHALATEAIGKVIQLLQAGKKVVVCSSTKKFTTTLEAYVQAKLPEITMVVCNGDKANDLEDVNRSWKRDLLVYSPSVSAGVSFEEDHFDSLVGYLVSSHFTPGVDIALQQLYRVRNLRDGDMHIFLQDTIGDACDDFPVSDTQIDTMLSGSMAIVNKYYLTHQLSAMAQQNIEDNEIKFDKTRLSYLIIKGIISMRHRSLLKYADILRNTLESDYKVACDVVYEYADSDAIEVDIGELVSASKKVKSVEYSSVRHLILEPNGDAEARLIKDSLQEGGKVPELDIAALRLYEATRRWMADPTKIDEDFFKDHVVAHTDLYRKARRYGALVEDSLRKIQTDMSVAVRKLVSVVTVRGDSNLDVYKSKLVDDYTMLIIGVKFLQLCLKPAQMEEFKKLNTVTIGAQDMDNAFKALKCAMTGVELHQMFKVFDLKESCTDLIALKKVMSMAFNMTVNRQSVKNHCRGFKLIDISPKAWKHMRDTYSAGLLKFCDDSDGEY